VRNKALSRHTPTLILFALLLAAGYTGSQAWGDASGTSGPASASSPAIATTQPSPGNMSAPAASSNAALVIDPQVRAVLNRVCSELSSARTITYHAEINFDSVLPSGVKLQYAAAMDTAIKRPDHLAIDYKGDLGAKAIWYDGRTLTIFDPVYRVYASIAAPGSIDAMFKQVAEEKNLSIPAEGLDFNDECGRAFRDIQRGKFVGINDVGGVDCYHLAFIQGEADWQLWVDHNGRPLPRKIVITYKKLLSQPQWSAVFSNWRLNQVLPASLFQPKIPQGAVRASFMGPQEKRR